MMTADRDRIWRAIVEIGTCMMVTRDGEMLRARPMQALAEPEENTIWFLSERDAHKDQEVTVDPHTCLAFANVDDDLYVSLSGHMEIVDDRTRINALLADSEDDDSQVQETKSEGADTAAAETLVALRFTPEAGEIWDGWSVGDDDDEDEALTGGELITFSDHRRGKGNA